VLGAEATQHLLTQTLRPDGLFCFSDPMAIGAMQSALAAGVSIPGQLAIVGCGNLHYDESLRVPLSSMDQKSERIGERAAAIILEQVIRKKYDDKPSGPVAYTRVNLKPDLVVRQSSQR
jgi:LacI family transcriptional regulator